LEERVEGRGQKIVLEKREMKWHAGYRGGLFAKQNVRAHFHYAGLFYAVSKTNYYWILRNYRDPTRSVKCNLEQKNEFQVVHTYTDFYIPTVQDGEHAVA
jgi:hypothetical protein